MGAELFRAVLTGRRSLSVEDLSAKHLWWSKRPTVPKNFGVLDRDFLDEAPFVENKSSSPLHFPSPRLPSNSQLGIEPFCLWFLPSFLGMLGAARSGQLLFRALRTTSHTTSFLPATSITPLRRNVLPRLTLLGSRSLYTTPPRANYAPAQQSDEYSSDADPIPPPSRNAPTGPITMFSELAERGLVHGRVIETITNGMNITTMTPVQSLTISQTLNGTDT